MARYRKVPVVIEAVQLPPEGEDGGDELIALLQGHDVDNDGAGGLYIHTLEGTMLAAPGDWIIRGVAGEVYPVKPDIFEQTYEKAED